MTPDDEARERMRALDLLRKAFPDYRIVYGNGRWAAAAAGNPPMVWFADTPRQPLRAVVHGSGPERR